MLWGAGMAILRDGGQRPHPGLSDGTGEIFPLSKMDGALWMWPVPPITGMIMGAISCGVADEYNATEMARRAGDAGRIARPGGPVSCGAMACRTAGIPAGARDSARKLLQNMGFPRKSTVPVS